MKKILVLVAMMGFGFNASADYIKGQLGYTIGGDIDSEFASADFKKEVLSPMMIGYGKEMSPNFAMEYELVRYSNKVEAFGLTSEESVGVLGLGINGIYNLTMAEGAPVKPYVGGGLLFGNYGDDDDDEFGVGIQLMLGMDFAGDDKFAIGAEFRYGTTIVAPEFDDTEIDFNYMSIGITGKYRL